MCMIFKIHILDTCGPSFKSIHPSHHSLKEENCDSRQYLPVELFHVAVVTLRGSYH